MFRIYNSGLIKFNDVDTILVVLDDFSSENCPAESSVLFDHTRADNELGASIFWVRPNMLLGEPLDQFLTFWQTKRDGRRRSVVEVRQWIRAIKN